MIFMDLSCKLLSCKVLISEKRVRKRAHACEKLFCVQLVTNYAVKLVMNYAVNLVTKCGQISYELCGQFSYKMWSN